MPSGAGAARGHKIRGSLTQAASERCSAECVSTCSPSPRGLSAKVEWTGIQEIREKTSNGARYPGDEGGGTSTNERQVLS